MKELTITIHGVAGGATFYYMMQELFKRNNIQKVKLCKNWKNNKTVFIIKGKKYTIHQDSYIFNYDGELELEEFFGKTREINGTTITSSYADAVECYPTEKEIALYLGEEEKRGLPLVLESYRTMTI